MFNFGRVLSDSTKYQPSNWIRHSLKKINLSELILFQSLLKGRLCTPAEVARSVADAVTGDLWKHESSIYPPWYWSVRFIFTFALWEQLLPAQHRKRKTRLKDTWRVHTNYIWEHFSETDFSHTISISLPDGYMTLNIWSYLHCHFESHLYSNSGWQSAIYHQIQV